MVWPIGNMFLPYTKGKLQIQSVQKVTEKITANYKLFVITNVVGKKPSFYATFPVYEILRN